MCVYGFPLWSVKALLLQCLWVCYMYPHKAHVKVKGQLCCELNRTVLWLMGRGSSFHLRCILFLIKICEWDLVSVYKPLVFIWFSFSFPVAKKIRVRMIQFQNLILKKPHIRNMIIKMPVPISFSLEHFAPFSVAFKRERDGHNGTKYVS